LNAPFELLWDSLSKNGDIPLAIHLLYQPHGSRVNMKGSSLFKFSPFAKIHQPLPRTPRESAQLLNALTSSFRRQLDREYPSSSSSANNDETGDNPLSSVHATDKHLRTILENPLFRVTPSNAASPGHQSGLGPLQEQKLATEPMTVFDELVASGSVNKTALFNCLRAQLVLASAHTGDGVVDAMKKSKAGSKIVSWWYASDSENRKMLFTIRSSTVTLLKFMVAEGLQKTAMAWLAMLLNRDLGGADGRISEAMAQTVARNFLLDLLKAEIQYGEGLVSAMRYYLEASRLPISTDYELGLVQYKKALLMPAAGFLCRAAMEGEQSQLKQMPLEMYDEYVRIIASWSLKSLLLACVPLFHPTRPDATRFVQFTERISRVRLTTWPKTKKENFVLYAITAIRILVDQQKFAEASYLARFIQENLPEKIGQESASSTFNQVSAEEENLSNLLGMA
jgi:hypothetical protein